MKIITLIKYAVLEMTGLYTVVVNIPLLGCRNRHPIFHSNISRPVLLFVRHMS